MTDNFTNLDVIIETLLDVLNNVPELPSVDPERDFGIPDNLLEMDIRKARAFYDFHGDEYEHGDIYAYQATSISSIIRVVYIVHYDTRGNMTRRQYQTLFPSWIRRAVEKESGPGRKFQAVAKCRMECISVSIDARVDPKFGMLALFRASEYQTA